MDLRSSYPYWLLKHGIVKPYPSLKESQKAEVAIIGAGITGSLMASYLCNAGVDVAILDRRHVGQGSTAASTGLLQYEIDTPLHKLIPMVGEHHAVRSYELCLEAIHTLEKLSQKHTDIGFKRCPSFQFASYRKHVKLLEKEMQLRTLYNISSLTWLDDGDVQKKFGFHGPAGILSTDGACMDAYEMTHALLRSAKRKGLRVYDNTEVVKIIHHKRSVDLITGEGKKITARKIIICCGYESQRYLPMKVEQMNSTYAIVSEPFEHDSFWYKDSLIWETSVPYLYMRTTHDNRILIGGKDDPFYNPARRDAQLMKKRSQLEKSFQKMFPHIPFKTDFEWAGTFCGTKDGLPFIGSIKQRPHTYFALGFGGNGITFSVMAAQILRDVLLGKKNPDAEIFSFDRL